MDYINKDFDNSKEFTIIKNRVLIEYKAKYLKTKQKVKKELINQTLKCIKTSKNSNDINSCKHNESINLEKIYLSYEDNPRLKNIIDKDELIEIFSKTLKCFESSRTKRDIYFCKNNEKNRIIKYLN
jgi:hypothetical protein